jgi:hypothetical protein
MEFPRLLLLCGACLFTANAATVYSNFGPGDSFAASGWAVGDSATPFGIYTVELAMGFVPTGDFVFTGVDFPLRYFSGSEGVTVKLRSTGPAGIPDSVIESITAPDQSGQPLVSVQSRLNPLLLGGTRYWLTLAGGSTGAVWFDSNHETTGPVAMAYGAPDFFLLTDSAGTPPIQAAFRILGTLSGEDPSGGSAQIPVPESSTGFLTGLGLLSACALLRQARRSQVC